MNDPKVCLTDGSTPDDDYRNLKPNGQQEDYLVLCPEERAKGYVRPYRDTYRHVGIRPKYPVRDLTDDEKARYDQFGYLVFEAYPESEAPATGRFWTAAQLKSGCGGVTSMSQPIAETYARNPKFYSGTFCVGCGKHFPLEEFVWDGTNEHVGS